MKPHTLNIALIKDNTFFLHSLNLDNLQKIMQKNMKYKTTEKCFFFQDKRDLKHEFLVKSNAYPVKLKEGNT